MGRAGTGNGNGENWNWKWEWGELELGMGTAGIRIGESQNWEWGELGLQMRARDWDWAELGFRMGLGRVGIGIKIGQSRDQEQQGRVGAPVTARMGLEFLIPTKNQESGGE